MTRIFIFSDTHTYHTQLSIPKNIDLMIFCGDESNKNNPYENELEARWFFEWYSILPARYKIYIPGNHSAAVFKKLIRPSEYPEIIFLEHSSVIIEGLKIFGSPYTPSYGNWYYLYARKDAYKYWDVIPNDTDILVTHGMPKGTLDLADDETNRSNIAQVGCKTLARRIEEVKPRIFAGGHLHSTDRFNNYGCYYRNGIYYFNASCLNHRSTQLNPGHIIQINGKELTIL